MRVTVQVRRVLAVLLDATSEMYGLEIGDAADVDPRSIYAMLGRLEKAGWVTSRWEDDLPVVEGRHRRRYWRITDEGRAEASTHLGSIRPLRG